jgi:hypothetical protein
MTRIGGRHCRRWADSFAITLRRLRRIGPNHPSGELGRANRRRLNDRACRNNGDDELQSHEYLSLL